VFVAINVSPQALLSEELRAAIPRSVAADLVIELTEHTPVLDYKALGRALGPIRDYGARLAIDDAGAGFASLRHILELAPQFIKLDVSIIQRIEHDRAALALAIALTSFAGAIGATIIAEGIETQSQLVAVRALGVPFGQGYHLARPGPIEQLATMSGLRRLDAGRPQAGAGVSRL
jgi:EAL domain-containing protein (putative c-di-GMP-specific phosphodiesterase class I)